MRGLFMWLLSLLPVLLGLCLFLAFGVSLIVPLVRYLLQGDYAWLTSALVYLFLVAGLGWWLTRYPAHHEPRLVCVLVGGSALLKLALVLAIPELPLNIDQAILRMFVEEMADHRLSHDAMAALSVNNDYMLWSSRTLPVHVLLRVWGGAGYILWLRVANVAASTALLVLIYLFARRLLPEGKRKWAVFLMVILPFQTFVTTDFSHHLYSSLYLLLGVWCAFELAFIGHTRVGKTLFSLTAGLSLLLMMLQRGVHLIALGIWAGILVWAAMDGRGRRSWLSLAVLLMALPLAISLPAVLQVDGWLRANDQHQRSSLLPAFVARGWCPETSGEFCGRYEHIDWATPLEERAETMWRLVFSQIRHNTGVICLKFPPMKTAKLFLVGYASNIEESLDAMKSPRLAWARGVRLAAAPVFVGFAAWGCFMLGCTFPAGSIRWLPILLAPILTWGSYVFLGETSPRYSIFCQAFLALLGAQVFCRSGDGGPWTRRKTAQVARKLVSRSSAALLILVLVIGVAAAMVHLTPAHHFFANLERGWESVARDGRDAEVKLGHYRPFEAQLAMSADQVSADARFRLPVPFDQPVTVSFYLLGVASSLRDAEMLVMSDAGEILEKRSLQNFDRPIHIGIELPRETSILDFRLQRKSSRNAAGSVQIGYLLVQETTGEIGMKSSFK